MAHKIRQTSHQIPDSILNDEELSVDIGQLPDNYNFEIHKSVWRIRTTEAKRVALQFPEGLLLYACVIADILEKHTGKCSVLALKIATRIIFTFLKRNLPYLQLSKFAILRLKLCREPKKVTQ